MPLMPMNTGTITPTNMATDMIMRMKVKQLKKFPIGYPHG